MGILVTSPSPDHHQTKPRKRHVGDFSVKHVFGSSDIKNENTIGERQIKRPRERDVERDGGSLKGRDLTRFMLHVYKMTIALFCHYSGCAVLESDGVKCAG